MDRLSFRVMAQTFGVGFFLVALVFMGSKTVYADPHAVFYTATGQQQLFFNVLAGLNQADYVEPAKPQTGTPAGQSRQDILQKRTEAGFGPAQDPTLNATKTNLSGLLTRTITLEGNDVWSSYLSFQFALEAVRRKNSAELVRIMCQHGFGLKNCKAGSEDPQTAAARQKQAIEANPEDITARSQQAVISSLFSNTPSDQAARLDLINNDDDVNKLRLYNDSIGALNANTAGNQTAQQYVNMWAQDAAHAGSSVGSSVFNNISFNRNGSVDSVNTSDTITTVGLLSSILAQPAQFFSARVLAEERQAQQDSITMVDGVRSDTYGVPHASGNGIGEISEQIKVPATAKINEQNTALNTLAEVNATRYFTGTQENIPGTAQIVNRGSQNPAVEGASTDSSLPAIVGQVLGVSTSPNPSPEPKDELPPDPTPQPPIQRDSNPVGFNQEIDIDSFLSFLIDSDNSGGCGRSCSMTGVISTYGSSVLK